MDSGDISAKEKQMLMSFIEDTVNNNTIAIFTKSWCKFCAKTKELLRSQNIDFYEVELDKIPTGIKLQDLLRQKYDHSTVPLIVINQRILGGFSDLLQVNECGMLEELIKKKEAPNYDYDLIVIGGGSGGIAAAKEASKLGKKVAICNFVTPSPQGTTWGFGGTCVNVGCIPKKLMHRAALIGHDIDDGSDFGWTDAVRGNHDWATLVTNVGDHIKKLSFNYRKQFTQAKIPILNAYASFVDNHTIKTTDKAGKRKIVTAQNFLIAVGLRPKYPDIPGAIEHGISSDDIFTLSNPPGETLIVGASYIALECAGFLAGLNIKCTVMVRSILLRGFDQEVAGKIEKSLQSMRIRFIRGVPGTITKLDDGKLLVHSKLNNGEKFLEKFDTVLFAIGREPVMDDMNIDVIGIAVNPKNKKIIVNEKEQTSVKNIFAVGDVIEQLELTPVAIQAGKLLAQRLYNGKTRLMDYSYVPTTVFTPVEYGCVGLSEEKAIGMYSTERIEVFHNVFEPLESALSSRFDSESFVKLICLKTEGDKELKVIGLHIFGPNAGEITQGFALALKMGATKEQFDNLVGIHPTSAEVFTTMEITKSSGKALTTDGC